MNCKCCGKEMQSDIQFRYGKVNGRIVATDSFEIVTCRTPGCWAVDATASVPCYDQTIDAIVASRKAQAAVLLDAPARADETIRF